MKHTSGAYTLAPSRGQRKTDRTVAATLRQAGAPAMGCNRFGSLVATCGWVFYSLWLFCLAGQSFCSPTLSSDISPATLTRHDRSARLWWRDKKRDSILRCIVEHF